jgi:hypothetical protein
MNFEKWFKAQHGPRARRRDFLRVSDDSLSIQVTIGKLAEAELAARREWDERKTSALWAWNARAADEVRMHL